MVSSVLFSSKTCEHETPQDLFDNLKKEFPFTLDVCATAENKKCDRYFNKEEDGLSRGWGTDVCWMNPPYGEPELPCKAKCTKKKCEKRKHHIAVYVPGIRDWVKKAFTAASFGATVVCLLPARTDTKWWHDYVLDHGEIRFIRGRLKFGQAKNSAPFPSAIVVFRPFGGVGEVDGEMRN